MTWGMLKERFGKRGATAAGEPAPRMQISAIAAKIGLPEERVAQIAQMIKSQGLADSQMGPMMRMATEKGVEPREILDMLTSLGIPQGQVVRVMSSQGLIDDTEAQRLIEEERRARRGTRRSRQTKWRAPIARQGGHYRVLACDMAAARCVIDNRLVLSRSHPCGAGARRADRPADFWVICGASFGRIALGFLLSFVVGFLLALMSCRHRLFRDFVDPIISLLRTIPVASFIILLLIWVGNQALTVFLAFFIVLPLIYTNMVTGFESVDRQMLEMARVYGLSRWRTFLYIYRPAFMPFLMSSTKISLGMTWKSGIMAEVLATPEAVHRQRNGHGAHVFDTPDLLAWTVVVMVLSFLFEKAFMELLKRANRPLGGFIGSDGGEADSGEGKEARNG